MVTDEKLEIHAGAYWTFASSMVYMDKTKRYAHAVQIDSLFFFYCSDYCISSAGSKGVNDLIAS